MWNAKVKVLGLDIPVPWIATNDIGALATMMFNNPEEYIGRGLKPVGDWKTVRECRQIYQELSGKKPSRIPLPIWLMKLAVPQTTDMVNMWEWMLSVDDMTAVQNDPLTDYLTEFKDVRSFLQQELASEAN